jgi:hypothetical protein
MYEWDEAKRQENLRKHGVDFSIVDGFDWLSSIASEDVSERYGEPLYFDRTHRHKALRLGLDGAGGRDHSRHKFARGKPVGKETA